MLPKSYFSCGGVLWTSGGARQSPHEGPCRHDGQFAQCHRVILAGQTMRTLDIDTIWPTPPPGPVGATAHAAMSQTAAAQYPREPQPLSAWEQSDDDGVPARLWPAAVSGLTQRAARFFRSFDHAAAVYVALGFMAGISAWHAVGFWSFVSDVVLNGGAAPAPLSLSGQLKVQVQATPHTTLQTPTPITTGPITTGPITTGSLAAFAVPAEHCVALAINRESGMAATTACRDDTEPMRDAGRSRRENRAEGPVTRLDDTKTWAASTEFDTAGEVSSSVRQTLEPADVNLDLNTVP